MTIRIRAKLIKLTPVFRFCSTEYVPTGEHMTVEVTGETVESCLGQIHANLRDWVALSYEVL